MTKQELSSIQIALRVRAEQIRSHGLMKGMPELLDRAADAIGEAHDLGRAEAFREAVDAADKFETPHIDIPIAGDFPLHPVAAHLAETFKTDMDAL